MKLEIKALQKSLFIHFLLFILIFILGRSSFHANEIVVIDLTLMEPVTAAIGDTGDKKRAVFEPQKKQEGFKSEKIKTVNKFETDAVKEGETEKVAKLIQDNEDTEVEEKIPELEEKTVNQEYKQNWGTGTRGSIDRETAFLTGTRKIESSLSGYGIVPETETNQVPGKGPGDNSGVMKGYLGSHLSYIKELIQKNITYPDIARRNGWAGKVKVSFIIAYNGYAKNIKVMQSSGFKILDKNAMEAVKRSSPFPKPPVEARIILPILYELN